MAKILIVDDTALIRAMASDLLAAKGHAVEEAADGPPALEMIAKNNYDLVLLDIQLPGLDGFGVLAELQKRGGKQPKVLVMTDVRNGADDVAKARTLGANGFLAKAALNDQLVFRAQQLLGLPA